MYFRTQAFLLTALISLLLALIVWTRKERSRTTLPFSLCNAFLFAYAAFYVAFKYTGQSYFLRACITSASFMLPSYLYLAYSYFFRQNRALEVALVALFGIAAAFAVTAFIPAFDTVMHFLSLFPPDVRDARSAAAVVIIGLPTLSLIISRMLREKERLLKRRYIGLAVASGATTAVIALDVRSGGGAVGTIAQVLFNYYLYQSLVRFHTFRWPRFLANLAILIFSTVFLTIVYGLFFFFVRPLPLLFLFHSVVAAFMLIVIYEPFLGSLETFAREFVLRGADVGRRIDRLLAELSEHFTLESIGDFLVNRVPRELGLGGAAVFLKTEGGGLERLAASLAVPERLSADIQDALETAVREPIALERLVQLASEGYPGEEKERYLRLIGLLNQCQGRWLVPMRHRGETIGLYVPSPSLTRESGADAGWILGAMAEQAAVRIVNAHIYQKLRSQDRLATLGVLAASLAHEIRNPLGSMKGAAQFLIGEDLPKESREFVEIILDEADRLNGVLTRFLDYARPFELSRGPVDLNAVIRATVSLLMEGEKPPSIDVGLDLDESVGIQYLDGEQIRQVLINLVKNAWQAQPGGGEVLIVSRIAGNKIVIEVADRGPGVNPADREKLFMPFFSTKKGGTGLGLTISQRVIQAHGGRILAQPRPGGGSRFLVELPAAELSGIEGGNP